MRNTGSQNGNGTKMSKLVLVAIVVLRSSTYVRSTFSSHLIFSSTYYIAHLPHPRCRHSSNPTHLHIQHSTPTSHRHISPHPFSYFSHIFSCSHLSPPQTYNNHHCAVYPCQNVPGKPGPHSALDMYTDKHDVQIVCFHTDNGDNSKNHGSAHLRRLQNERIQGN